MVEPRSRLGFKFFGTLPSIDFPDNISGVALRTQAVISHYPAAPIDWDAAIEIDWFDEDIEEGRLAVNSFGVFNPRIYALGRLALDSFATFITAINLSSNISRIGVRSFADIFADANRSNWIKWSGIGSLDFAIGKDNVAGERPLDWKGLVYAIKKLAGKVVAYGENGVSILTPAGNAYGLDTIYRIGLKGKNAIVGDDSSHFFIDKIGQLWRLGESLNKLDYSEYFSGMNSSLVMSYDNLNQLIYICDGTIGYVYNPLVGSLGRGQPNVTGIAAQSGNFYITAPTTIITPPFEFCTDVYDFGTRSNKTILSLEIGIDIISTLYAAIDYKRNIAGPFVRTPWVSVPSKGKVFIIAFGREFRFRLKTITYEWFILNYINVNGIAHDD